jgi:hypothetical protein
MSFSKIVVGMASGDGFICDDCYVDTVDIKPPVGRMFVTDI